MTWPLDNSSMTCPPNGNIPHPHRRPGVPNTREALSPTHSCSCPGVPISHIIRPHHTPMFHGTPSRLDLSRLARRRSVVRANVAPPLLMRTYQPRTIFVSSVVLRMGKASYVTMVRPAGTLSVWVWMRFPRATGIAPVASIHQRTILWLQMLFWIMIYRHHRLLLSSHSLFYLLHRTQRLLPASPQLPSIISP